MVYALLAVALTGIAACERKAAPITPCIGDEPAVPRIRDVAPPNCPN
jgi:hypothetical protein